MSAPVYGASLGHLPKAHIEQFLIQNFDIASIRSSMGPRRRPGDRHFSDLGIKPLKIETNHIVLGSEGWRYDIRIIERDDLNSDGVADLYVCFTDDGRGAGGSYYTVKPLLLTRYSAKGLLIALSYSPPETTACHTKPTGTPGE